ncbi:MAG: glucan biosynthesis protein G [Luteolibacter sp.]
MPRYFILFAAIATFSQSAFSQTWERDKLEFSEIENRAKDLAGKPYVSPNRGVLPDWMKNLTYDQYRDIRFNTDQALWVSEKLPFRAMFFHPGYLFRDPVTLNEFTETHEQRVRLADAFFNYGPLVKNRGEFPPDGGFAGFRLHAPLNSADYYDELIVFQGASYWRALGKKQRYGISSRGIAVDTGVDGATEEFPMFREFWLRKPKADDKSARIYALLDGPSYTGAYSFTVAPGDDTVVSVKAVLFCRKSVKRLGIAPMSSMFWFGENSRHRFDDFRPEVHDSDGLAIRMGTGERLWRPLVNDSPNLEFSFFNMDQCSGFGLLQRDRKFNSYEDGEAAYDLRPSLWIEPTSDWGPGRVMLLEIPAKNELEDNSVALWEPARTPQAGERIEFSYKQHWTMEEDPSQAGGHVVATRTGYHDWLPNQRTIIVEFAGSELTQPSETPITANVQAIGAAASRVEIRDITIQSLPEGRIRAAFQIAPAGGVEKIGDIGPVELRCALKRGDNYLTETWAYRITP